MTQYEQTVVGALVEIANSIKALASPPAPPAAVPTTPAPEPPAAAAPPSSGGQPEVSQPEVSQPESGAPPQEGQPESGEAISAELPYEPHFVDVLDSRMHYIEQGTGDPILFLHGNPTWSYLWRNVIPHLSPFGRCIAPDLIGFGKSGKPDIEYRWFDHVRYLETFIETLGLRNITLVIQDQGSGLGFHYAMRNEENVKGIAFFEAMVKPYPSWSGFPTSEASEEFRQLFRTFRTGGVHGPGWQLIVDQNIFIEQLMTGVMGRQLAPAELNAYLEPFRDPASRKPIWRFPNEIPIEHQPADVWDAVSTYSERLQTSDLPKLLLYGHPGAILTQELVDWCKQNLKNLETVDLGQGLHFYQESHPHQLGEAIAEWYQRLPVRP